MDKAQITPRLVSQLVAAQFPQWAELAVAPVEIDGNDNTTFRLGEELSVRLPSADEYVPQVEKEHRWLPVLAPQLPLPIPEPLARGKPALGFPRPFSGVGTAAGLCARRRHGLEPARRRRPAERRPGLRLHGGGRPGLRPRNRLDVLHGCEPRGVQGAAGTRR